jgi:predicted glutamine amidotransferase
VCLIIQRPAHAKLDFEKFKTAVENNPDGFGISAAEGFGGLITIRDVSKWKTDELFKLVDEEFIDVPLLVHLRYTTAGATNLRNAHPFPVLEYEADGVDLRMAHNGTLAAYKSNTDESDTRRFVRTFVRPLFKRLIKGMDIEQILKDDFTKQLLETQLTGSSVLSFIDGFGNMLNVNDLKNGGFYDEQGVYFSNKYSFDDWHRKPSWPTYQYKNPAPVTVFTPSTNYTQTKHAEDTRVQRFSDKYDLDGLHECLSLDKESIDTIVKDHPGDATLLIMELLEQYETLSRKKSVN